MTDDGVDILDDLVRRFRAGDDAAFRELVDRTELEVRSCVAAYAANLDMIDEAVQMAYVIAFRRIGDYRLEGTFQAWVKGIARNCLRSELRQRKRQVSSESMQLERWIVDRAQERLEADADLRAVREHRLRLLEECLHELPDPARSVLAQRYRSDRTAAQLAEEFGKSVAAMTKSLQRLLKSLRKCVEDRELAT
jgi:RNA polymerase sigma-70 factor, ECF subfamily